MNTAQPIRNKMELKKFKNYYRTTAPNNRNYLLVTIGLNTALRISDILKLQWMDVYDSARNCFRSHICLTEHKTGKISKIYINENLLEALTIYRSFLSDTQAPPTDGEYLFRGTGREPISRVQAYRIIKNAAIACEIPGSISPHSLRKTFGYFAWKSGIAPVMLMNLFNHSSFEITKRYLGIDQDDRDSVFRNILL